MPARFCATSSPKATNLAIAPGRSWRVFRRVIRRVHCNEKGSRDREMDDGTLD